MPAAEFVLHRDPMLLLDTLVECSEHHTACEWRIDSSNAFFEEGRGVPSYVGVEFMAQCVAVHAGARARAEGFGPPVGFLLGTRQFDTIVDYLRDGEVYCATCTELMNDANGMGSYDCCIFSGDKAIATARLAVLEKERGERLGGR